MVERSRRTYTASCRRPASRCCWTTATSGGIKFKDADLIGIPIRITVGKKSVVEGNVEVKLRAKPESEKVAIDKAPAKVMELIRTLREKVTL